MSTAKKPNDKHKENDREPVAPTEPVEADKVKTVEEHGVGPRDPYPTGGGE